MDNYRNPQPAEGINVSGNSPLLTFFKLLAGLLVIMGIIAWLLGKSGGWIAERVPYEQELALSQLYAEDTEAAKSHPDMQAYLDHLTERISNAMQLPEGMQIRAHYVDDDVENAFATLGGHIFLYRGLLERLPNENSLAMLIAHEAAHIKLRHPIKSLGQQMAISTGVRLMLGDTQTKVLGKTGLYTRMHFSRDMETDADVEGLHAVQTAYGHLAGALQLYDTLQTLSGSEERAGAADFFSTHPHDADRIRHLQQLAQQQGWATTGKAATPLPRQFRQWL